MAGDESSSSSSSLAAAMESRSPLSSVREQLVVSSLVVCYQYGDDLEVWFSVVYCLLAVLCSSDRRTLVRRGFVSEAPTCGAVRFVSIWWLVVYSRLVVWRSSDGIWLLVHRGELFFYLRLLSVSVIPSDQLKSRNFSTEKCFNFLILA